MTIHRYKLLFWAPGFLIAAGLSTACSSESVDDDEESAAGSAGSSSDGDNTAGSAGTGSSDGEGGSGSGDTASGTPTCSSACARIAAACGSASGCEDECESDQENAASCEQASDWEALLACCATATLGPYCEEGGFDACQKGACEQLRPSGAADGCYGGEE